MAGKLAAGSQLALRWTKRSLNHWLRAATPAFEASLGLEISTCSEPTSWRGSYAFLEKRPPQFTDLTGTADVP